MKPHLFSYFLLLACVSCSMQHTLPRLQSIPDGTWVCDQDTLSSLVFKGQYVFSYYAGKLIDTTVYVLGNQPCDTSYVSPSERNMLFIAWYDDLCHEVRYPDKRNFALIYTARGNLTTYHRRNNHQGDSMSPKSTTKT